MSQMIEMNPPRPLTFFKGEGDKLGHVSFSNYDGFSMSAMYVALDESDNVACADGGAKFAIGDPLPDASSKARRRNGRADNGGSEQKGSAARLARRAGEGPTGATLTHMPPLLATAGDDGVALWDGGAVARRRFSPHAAQKREHALTLRGHRAGVCALSWSPSEVHVASASTAGDVIVHRVQGSVAALATGSEDGVVSLWETAAPLRLPRAVQLHKFEAHSAACCGVAWSAVNHHLLVSAAADGSIVFYDTTRLAVVRTLCSDQSFTSLAFAPDGLHLACGAADGSACIFDLRSSDDSPLWSTRAHDGPVELIRELEAQRHEVRSLIEAGREEVAALREENAALREENARLRAPPLAALGLQRWGAGQGAACQRC
ncbi:hypothetical protein EMIHUDRAFT_241694 [Emiliania huxleyi CCMP1516]|uniref:Anaphase-promoting complex subunit 4 WD40 domain-containing protein n=2 Tax=Emiliania huxleyi TaxID=2903 RepID=A0A0D3JBJ5_EMIH1|nr:hypothetical protein EMIHUDRAFT_241694 [Emiliania huxleyi CCMP1516]EOD20880.1 hypothetical protein EMIHUDRAFT_241694 [Emiliania huxleyi CCMP1516]|eukprot:XP_005773309.1 hypothetical protein EMIHUDRAFT_241694 [Emiliania huxleyi CCMP1516]